MTKIREILKNASFRVFIFIFARPSMQRIVTRLLRILLRAYGYNNCCHPDKTGEGNFIRNLSTFNPKFCIDIGANIGNYSELLLKNTEAVIFAFEPLKQSFESLKKLEKKYQGRFFPFNLGLGESKQKRKFYYSLDHSEIASFCDDINEIDYVGQYNKSSSILQIDTLDNFFSKKSLEFEHIDLIKIDVEGLEYEILQGSTKVLQRFSPKFIQIEFNLHQLFRNHTMRSFHLLLDNYNLYQLLPNGSKPIKRNSKDPLVNIFTYANFLFVRKDIEL